MNRRATLPEESAVVPKELPDPQESAAGATTLPDGNSAGRLMVPLTSVADNVALALLSVTIKLLGVPAPIFEGEPSNSKLTSTPV